MALVLAHHVAADVLYLVDLLAGGRLFVEEHFDEGDEVVAAAEEHEGEGEDEAEDEAEVDDEEEGGRYLVVGERLEEVGLDAVPHVVVAQDAHQQIAEHAEKQGHKDRLAHPFIADILHALEDGEEVHLVAEGQYGVGDVRKGKEPIVGKGPHVPDWVVVGVAVGHCYDVDEDEDRQEDDDADDSEQGCKFEFLHFGDHHKRDLYGSEDEGHEVGLGVEGVQDLGVADGVLEDLPDG